MDLPCQVVGSDICRKQMEQISRQRLEWQPGIKRACYDPLLLHMAHGFRDLRARTTMENGESLIACKIDGHFNLLSMALYRSPSKRRGSISRMRRISEGIGADFS